MSIRKRYDEANLLIELKQFEAALIITLVAIAACSAIEGNKKGWSKDRQVCKDNKELIFRTDKHFFIQYLLDPKRDLLDPKRVNILGTNLIKGMAEALYSELRCTLIHEAVISEGKQFSDESSAFTWKAGSFQFGLGILQSLLRAIRLDENIAEQFEDLTHEFERKPHEFNMVEIDILIAETNEDSNQTLGDFAQFRQVTSGRKDTILKLIEHLGADAFVLENWPRMKNVIAQNQADLQYYSGNALNGGACSGLMSTHPEILDHDRAITEDGWGFLCKIASFACPTNQNTENSLGD